MRATAVMALVVAVGCTHDFDAYTPIGSGPVDAGDANSKPDASTADAALPCTETGAVTYAGHCYFAITGNFDFDGARSLCISRGARLATITSAGERDAVRIVGNARERWIGLSRPTSSPAVDASYQWLGGEPRAGFADWGPGEPNGSGACVRLLAVSGTWADDTCSDGHDALCERP